MLRCAVHCNLGKFMVVVLNFYKKTFSQVLRQKPDSSQAGQIQSIVKKTRLLSPHQNTRILRALW